jgi:predicted ATPase/DNA-binding SARP family transcriptional activator
MLQLLCYPLRHILLPMLTPASATLPQPHTRFIGREREVAEVLSLLGAVTNGERVRLLTLTGPGGCGKTRLALQVAHAFAADAAWIDLVSLPDPSYAPQTVAMQLSIDLPPGRSTLDALSDALRARRLLIVLDNCEHVLAACAALSHVVLNACPDVTILATSLHALGLPQEKVWRVASLAVPETRAALDAIDRCDSVQLFVERAREALPGFGLGPDNAEAIATICRRLDGLPLAIELAAARVKMLAPSQIAARLDDVFQLLTRGPSPLPRHQRLRAAMEWSYRFLSEAEQVLLRRLSAFAASFTLDMIEAVCTDDQNDAPHPTAFVLQRSDVLDVLTSLAENSLVELLPREAQPDARYRLLETIRQYAREQLEASGEAAIIRTRLLAWAVAFVETGEPRLVGPEAGTWLARLDAELDHVRVALQSARASRDLARGLRLAGALWLFWMNRGYLTEGRDWLEELLALSAQSPPIEIAPLVRAKALYAAAALAFRQGDQGRAAELAEASLSVARGAGDPARIATPLNLLAIVATEQGEYAKAAAIHEEALALHRQLGDPGRISHSLINLGIVARNQSDFARAILLYEEALAIKRRVGDKANMALVLSNLGEIAIFQGHYERAQGLLDESLMLYRELGHKNGVALALNNLSVAARHQGDAARAHKLLEECLAVYQHTGEVVRSSIAQLNLGDLARDAGDWSRAQSIYASSLAHFEAANDKWSGAMALCLLGLVAYEQRDDARALSLNLQSLEWYRSLSYALGMVEALEAIACVRARQGHLQQAARWLVAAERQREMMQTPAPSIERARYDEARRRVRAQFERSRSEAPALDQAVAEALALDPSRSAREPATPEPELRIYALGAARVLAGQRTLTHGDWTYHKSRELLFYFLSHPSATKEQIGLDLWPDASPTQLRNNFHRAMHHLRKALGRAEWIVFADETYAFNRELPYWCDAQVFEQHVRATRGVHRLEALAPAERAQAMQRLKTATELWRGDFAEDIDAGEWIIFHREELRRRYMNALLDLGQLYFADARYASAVEVYQRCLALDDYLELAHRELMRCYTRQGEASQALRHYQHLRDRLRRDLRAEPSPETTLLYERLRRGDGI